MDHVVEPKAAGRRAVSPASSCSEEGMLHLQVRCDGVHGSNWMRPLQDAHVVCSAHISTLLGVEDDLDLKAHGVLDVCILRSSHMRLVGNDGSVGDRVCQLGKKLKLKPAPMSLGCLLRTGFDNARIRNELGLARIIIMHTPVTFGDGPYLMQVEAENAFGPKDARGLTLFDAGMSCLAPRMARMGIPRRLDIGFAFVKNTLPPQ